MSDQTPQQIAARWAGAINSDSELGRAIVDIRVLASRCEALEKQAAQFKNIGQGFERDYRNTFEQSCKNLERAEAADDEVATLTARCEALEQRLSEVEAERGDLRDALVRVFGMGDGVTHDAQILAAAVDLMADQERMREALEAGRFALQEMFDVFGPEPETSCACHNCVALGIAKGALEVIAALSTPRQP